LEIFIKNHFKTMNDAAITTKTITVETNFNLKMGCDNFIHLDLAPINGVTDRMARETPIQIRTADNSHPPVVVYLVDLARTTLARVTALVSFLSHGLSRDEFASFIREKYGDAVGPATEMAVYFYSKHPDKF
jgi:hypothetical protein